MVFDADGAFVNLDATPSCAPITRLALHPSEPGGSVGAPLSDGHGSETPWRSKRWCQRVDTGTVLMVDRCTLSPGGAGDKLGRFFNPALDSACGLISLQGGHHAGPGNPTSAASRIGATRSTGGLHGTTPKACMNLTPWAGGLLRSKTCATFGLCGGSAVACIGGIRTTGRRGRPVLGRLGARSTRHHDTQVGNCKGGSTAGLTDSALSATDLAGTQTLPTAF